jgi:cyclophilin family peptidyl-prolyl cis-trans isomerase
MLPPGFLVALAVLVACGCSKSDSTTDPPSPTATGPGQPPGQAQPPTSLDTATTTDSTKSDTADQYPQVTFKTTMGDITVKLFAEQAPRTVKNFLANYVSRNFYNGTIFHHVEPGQIVMGGRYSEDLQEKEGLRAQILSEADNGLKNRRGTIAMARSPDHQHTATSQFFFNLCDNPSFDHVGRDNATDFGYCVFGEVVSGMDVLDKMGQLDIHETPTLSNCPKIPPVVLSVEQGT